MNQAARRKPRREQEPVALEWGWAWPINRRILYNRASADPDGKPWSERKKYVCWDEDAGKWTGDDVPDFEATKRPDYVPPEGAKAQDAIAGTDPFIMQSDGKAWLYAPAGLVDGPLPTHYEPAESAVENYLYDQQSSPTMRGIAGAVEPGEPLARARSSRSTCTTYRLTEHHTAGGMSRTLPYLVGAAAGVLRGGQPRARRAARAGATASSPRVISARTAVEARVLVTERIRPLKLRGGQVVHQIGIPYHWGRERHLDRRLGQRPARHRAWTPNTHIQESKASTCDIRPGRRPRGPELLEFVEDYRRRAGVRVGPGRRSAAGCRVEDPSEMEEAGA